MHLQFLIFILLPVTCQINPFVTFQHEIVHFQEWQDRDRSILFNNLKKKNSRKTFNPPHTKYFQRTGEINYSWQGRKCSFIYNQIIPSLYIGYNVKNSNHANPFNVIAHKDMIRNSVLFFCFTNQFFNQMKRSFQSICIVVIVG